MELLEYPLLVYPIFDVITHPFSNYITVSRWHFHTDRHIPYVGFPTIRVSELSRTFHTHLHTLNCIPVFWARRHNRMITIRQQQSRIVWIPRNMKNTKTTPTQTRTNTKRPHFVRRMRNTSSFIASLWWPFRRLRPPTPPRCWLWSATIKPPTKTQSQHLSYAQEFTAAHVRDPKVLIFGGSISSHSSRSRAGGDRAHDRRIEMRRWQPFAARRARSSCTVTTLYLVRVSRNWYDYIISECQPKSPDRRSVSLSLCTFHRDTLSRFANAAGADDSDTRMGGLSIMCECTVFNMRRLPRTPPSTIDNDAGRCCRCRSTMASPAPIRFSDDSNRLESTQSAQLFSVVINKKQRYNISFDILIEF